jgi:hypothetical protein
MYVYKCSVFLLSWYKSTKQEAANEGRRFTGAFVPVKQQAELVWPPCGHTSYSVVGSIYLLYYSVGPTLQKKFTEANEVTNC